MAGGVSNGALGGVAGQRCLADAAGVLEWVVDLVEAEPDELEHTVGALRVPVPER